MISYKHEPFVDFTNEENKKAYQEALQTVEGYLGQDYPLYIGAEQVTTDEKIVSYNPADKQEVIGRVSKANRILLKKPCRKLLPLLKAGKK